VGRARRARPRSRLWWHRAVCQSRARVAVRREGRHSEPDARPGRHRLLLPAVGQPRDPVDLAAHAGSVWMRIIRGLPSNFVDATSSDRGATGYPIAIARVTRPGSVIRLGMPLMPPPLVRSNYRSSVGERPYTYAPTTPSAFWSTRISAWGRNGDAASTSEAIASRGVSRSGGLPTRSAIGGLSRHGAAVNTRCRN
jgi:hypothetical protein